MFAKRFTKTAVTMLAATLVSALLVVGCSDGDDDNDSNSANNNNGGNNNGGNGNSSIINGPNDAWIYCGVESYQWYCGGHAFRNGTFFCSGTVETCWLGEECEGDIYYMGNTFYEDECGTYTISGNTLIASNEIGTVTFSISGNQLTFTSYEWGGWETVYTRRTGLTFIASPW